MIVHQLIIILLILLPCHLLANQAPLTNLEKSKIVNDSWQEAIKNTKPILHHNQMQEGPQQDNLKAVTPESLLSLNVNEMSLKEFLGILADELRLTLIYGSKIIDSKVTGVFDNQPASKILSAVLYPLSYGYKISGGNLIVLDTETRIYRVMLPPVSQSFEDTTSNESYQGVANAVDSESQGANQQVSVGSKVVVTNKSSDLSFWDDVALNVKSMISKEGQFSANRAAGTVLVTDTPVILDQIQHYFDDLNKRITQQIEVDVRVVEVHLSDEDRMGVDWSLLAKNLKELNALSLGTNFASSNFTNGNVFTFATQGKSNNGGVSESGVKFVVDALSKQGKVNVVSQPKVVMLNNQVSVIQVGSTQSYIDRSSIQTTQTGTVTSISTSQVQEGVTMRLLGNIVGDEIYLSVTPVVTTIDGIRTIQSGNTTIEAPQTTTKSINTLVKLREGVTVAIGGLITSSTQKHNEGVPVLSKIPLMGKLFSYSTKRNDRSELIIFITPKKV